MNPKIHDILKQAGIAHGILHDEAEIILVFSNPDFFALFCDALKRAHANDEISQEEYERILFEAEEIHRKAMRTQQAFRTAVTDAHKAAVNDFYLAKTEQLKQETEAISKLPEKFATLFHNK